MANIDVEDVLSKLTDREKISLLAGTRLTSLLLLLVSLLMHLQALTSGTPKPFLSTVSLLFASLTVPMAFAVPASSMVSRLRAFLVVQH